LGFTEQETMARNLIDEALAPDPKMRKLLGRAFHEVWHDIAGNYDATKIHDRQTRLAEVILRLVQDGESDLCKIKRKALENMRVKEQYTRH
jgi:hypothetical protein